VKQSLDIRNLVTQLVGEDTTTGKRLNGFVRVLIVLSLIAFPLETLPNLAPWFRQSLRAFEVLSVGVFSVEYLLRLYASNPPRRYLLSPLGVVDLLAVLPFYLGLGIDLRSLRVLRLLRLARVAKFARYNAAAARVLGALREAKEELVLFGAVTGAILYLAAVGIYYFESTAQPDTFGSVFDALWWAVITLTSVGYGDAIPITAGGKFFAGIVVLIGIGLVAVPTGILAAALTKSRTE